MAYRFRANESLIENVRRVACDEINAALAEIEDPSLELDVLVHQVRKRTKKVRGLLRLLREGMGKTAKEENVIFRDAAGRLSFARDADVALETLLNLKLALRRKLSKDAFGRLRQAVEQQQQQAINSSGAAADVPERVREFAAVMELARDRASGWELANVKSDDNQQREDERTLDESELLIDAVAETYRKARKRMLRANGDVCDESVPPVETAAAFHEWRKRVKDHGYHLRLLREISPDKMKDRGQLVTRLGELLGDDHDLDVLAQIIRNAPAELLTAAETDDALNVLTKQSKRLRDKAFEIGQELFQDRPQKFRERIADQWNDWHE